MQLGRGKTVRRAYGIDEIALVPGPRTLDPSLADTHWQIGGIEREIPIIASAMDGVVDVTMAIRLSQLGALGVLNLEGIQTRYADPNPILDKIASVGKDEFVGLMQSLYAEPTKPELITQRIQEIKSGGGIAAVSVTPAGAARFGQTIAAAGADLVFVQATVVSTAHLSPESIAPLDLVAFCQSMPRPVILGNCVTYEVALNLMKAGAAGVLVGIGPGRLDHMTPAAKQAIVRADAVIGYGLYIDQIRALCRPGQIVEPWPITQERQRAERAIDLARWGLSVVVVSSGDCGIYGMAGLVLEQLQATGWDGKTPAVEVFPGISALQAAAAQVGAPLMHDFCAISLSDLLTPWEMIVKRLEAAAQADFVIALYNPKSKTRTHQIETAHRILMAHRSPETPVAVVKSVYRPDQEVHLVPLANLLSAPIDMMTVVLIGNASTRQHQDWLITPRGYLGFNRP